jgi:beta-galactosidase
MAVHIPNTRNIGERVGPWGWQEERQSWTWPGYAESKEPLRLPVRVFAKDCCDSVRLELNGKEVGGGAQPVNADGEFKAVFDVAYVPGTLVAIGLKDNKPVGGEGGGYHTPYRMLYTIWHIICCTSHTIAYAVHHTP